MMDVAFLISCVLLGAILSWESFAVHSVLKESAKMRMAIRQRIWDRANRWPSWIGGFRGKEVGTNGCLTNINLEGRASALLFTDSGPKLLPAMQKELDLARSLLAETSTRRNLYVLLGTKGDEQSLAVAKLLDDLPQLKNRMARLIYDQNYAIAKHFRVRRFPTMMLVGPEGDVSRVWAGPSVCWHGGKKIVRSSPITDADVVATRNGSGQHY